MATLPVAEIGPGSGIAELVGLRCWDHGEVLLVLITVSP